MEPVISEQESLTPRLGMMLRRETWHNFRWDFISAFLISMFNAVFGQFYMPMAIRAGASNLEVGVLAAAPAIGLLISPVWAGLIAGRSPKGFAIYPNLVGRLSLIVVAIWPKASVFVAISLVINFLGGIASPAYAALVTRMYPPRQRGRLMGYVRVVLGLAMLPLAYGIGVWSDKAGDSGPLWAAAITGVISSIVFLNVREVEPKPPASPGRAGFRQQWETVRGNVPLLMFFLATTLGGFGNLVANPLYQIYQVHTLDLNNVQIAYLRMVYFLLLLLAYLVMGSVIDRYSARVAMIYGMSTYVLAALAYALFGTYWAALLSSALLGIGDATWDIGCMSYVFQLAPGREGVVFGIHLMLFGIRGTLAPIFATGITHYIRVGDVFAMSAAIVALGVLSLVIAPRIGRRPQQAWVP